MYLSYVPRLVDFVADSDVESLVLFISSAVHLLAALWARYRKMAFATRGPVGLGNTAFEGLDFLKPAESYLYQNLV